MAQKKGIRKRRCVRCARGEFLVVSEAGLMRSYESYWHFANRSERRMVECVDSLHHEVRRLRRDRDFLLNRVNELMKEKCSNVRS